PDNPPLGEPTPPVEPIRPAAPPTAEAAGDPAEAPRSEFSSTTPEHAEQPSGSGEPELPDNPPLGEPTPPVEPIRPAAPPTAEAEQGVPYVGDGERVLETVSTESEAKDESEPAHAVETVSEKPANPRRGWWQRLIPS
ncbi:MAG: hypothetical protein J2P48_23455, partial [Alphaproteobacteria bacterium]|nr:hypothetical protein [Alphaproteobacteria bacterium]